VIEMQSDSAYYWLKEFGLDGYRHDATKHVDIPFWRTLTEKINKGVVEEEGRPVYQIGETYGSRQLISTYIGSGLLDAQFDFPLYFDMRNVLLDDNTPFSNFKTIPEQTLSTFGHHHTMGNMTGNHDQPRFVSLAGGGLRVDEDQRAAGFERDVTVGSDVGYDKLRVMHAILMSIPGFPVNFYGDEIGIPGANDPDCRRMMRFDGWNEQEALTHERFTRLANIRRSNMPLMYGSTSVVHADENTVAIKRSYFNEHTLVLINKSNGSVSLEIPMEDIGEFTVLYGEAPTINNNSISCTLPPFGYQFHSYEE